MAFVFLILVGYAFLWKKGGLDLGPASRAVGRSGEPRLAVDL
jgi:hypothetical protein